VDAEVRHVSGACVVEDDVPVDGDADRSSGRDVTGGDAHPGQLLVQRAL
jgi:hypothetical protein